MEKYLYILKHYKSKTWTLQKAGSSY